MLKYISLILTLTTFSLNAQSNYKISGTIIDNEGLPQIGASVALHNPKDSSIITGGVTKVGGNFNFNAKEGTYYIKITSVGMEPKVLDNINLSSDLKLGIIKIAQSSVLTDEVLVTAEKSIMELKLDKRIYNVNKDASNIGRNGSEILDNIPSVNVDPEGNVSLRGSGNVQILLNGKQSGMVSNDPESLRQLMGDMIEKIEIITNPSARYDAQGEVGIINIVLKKKQEAGYNGNFELRTGYPDNHAVTVSSNYRSESMNLFGSAGVNYRNSPGSGNTDQRFTVFDTYNYTNTNLDRERGGTGINLNIGSDFYLDDDNTLTFAGNYRFRDGDNLSKIIYSDYLPDGSLYRTTNRDDNENESKNDIELNVTYEKKFDGNKDHYLRFDSRYEQNKDIENSEINQFNSLTTDETEQKSYNLEFERNQLYQLDYVYPFSEEGKFETGAKANLRKVDNDYNVQQKVDGEFEFLDGYNNNFVYYENIYAAYVMLGNQIDEFGWQVGVRSEYSDITSELLRTNYTNQRDYINFFPSAHFNYKIGEQNSLQASYSSRIQRPWFRSLMPFSSFTDSRNIWGGNPDLNPEYTDSYELGYLLNWETGSILSNVYYRHGTDIIQSVTYIDTTGITQIRPSNIGIQNSYGVEFNLSNDITDWWNTNINFNLYSSTITGNESVYNLNTEYFSWNTRFSSKLKISSYNFQITANYRAPEGTPQGENLSMWWLDFGLSTDILDNNATLTLSGQDVFSTRLRRSIVNGETFSRNSDYQWRKGQVTLTFAYRINQAKKREKPVFDGDGGDGM
ncbi:MAG: TonB-dependent receptor [Ignavibacteriae bacterium HGW-Ignavibacteriae-4]|jgi:outer membrane receptor protein involved in Fe transport|nr:MAG: TonB-dependent receptor [Ignavibacteriae bacterium HGW-Ignavibacteriae-4]